MRKKEKYLYLSTKQYSISKLLQCLCFIQVSAAMHNRYHRMTVRTCIITVAARSTGPLLATAIDYATDNTPNLGVECRTSWTADARRRRGVEPPKGRDDGFNL